MSDQAAHSGAPDGGRAPPPPGLPPGASVDDAHLPPWPPGLERPKDVSLADAAVLAAIGEAQLYSTGTAVSVEDYNAEYAIVRTGGKVLVLQENPPDPRGLVPRIELMSKNDFELWTRPQKTVVLTEAGTRGKLYGRVIPSSTIWMASDRRRQYRGIEFEPGPYGEDRTSPGAYNLWRGYAVDPDPNGEPRCRKFLAHILDNVADGNVEIYDWILGFLAQMVQEPDSRPGVALVMRGGEGVGKSTVGDVVGMLFPDNYKPVDQSRYVTGNFNAHLADCLLLQADEAFWAGDHDAAGRLKGMVTGPYQMIERKNVDPIKVANYVRLMITSNSDWVVPTGLDARRFCVVDVGDARKDDKAYFREMREDLMQGGLQGLLHHLLSFDLSSVDLKQIPQTSALFEQKIRGMTAEQSWWFNRLQDGAPLAAMDDWPAAVPKSAVLSDYSTYAERIGMSHKLNATSLSLRLRAMVPGLGSGRHTVEIDTGGPVPERQQQRCYELPDLQTCRKHFEKLMKQSVEWEPPPANAA